MTLCPACRKPNRFANDLGHTDGPREYHAICWFSYLARIDAILDDLRQCYVVTDYGRDLTAIESEYTLWRLDSITHDDVVQELQINCYDMGSIEANVTAAASSLCTPPNESECLQIAFVAK